MIRTGIGYDVHRLAENRRLVLGGVEIPYEKGLLGHSDADVLAHAVCDALLGAVGLGDIGEHFPDTDPNYENADSMGLLRQVARMLLSRNCRVRNIDAVVFAEKPKLSPHKERMRKNIAAAVDIQTAQVNIKATTTEGLGPIGRGEGIAAMCSVLIEDNTGSNTP